MSEHPWGLIRTGHVWLQAVVFEVKRESPMLTSGTLKTPGGRAEEWTTLVVGGGGGCERKGGRIENALEGTEKGMGAVWRSDEQYGPGLLLVPCCCTHSDT